jgi:hypothetical protein
MKNQFGSPILISAHGKKILERLPLSGAGASEYDEKWLQDLLFKNPQALPISELDQSYVNLIPICQELNTPAGAIDLLYVTPEGKLIILEAKLWRNPEARRKVIGQILDYAKEISRWTYEGLQREITRSLRTSAGTPKRLYDLVAEQYPDLVEADFVDAVSRSLKHGEFLLLIVGDGIREGVAAITEFIENHGTLHFSFGLVEMAIYRLDNKDLLVQPRVLAQTMIVNRTVITLEADGLIAKNAEEIEKDESGEMSESQKFYSEFWSEFLSDLKLDDAAQPLPKSTTLGNIFLRMPAKSNSWITVYFYRKTKEVGVFLTFSRGALADMIYDKLLNDKETIENELREKLSWKSSDGKHTVGTLSYYDDLRSTANREPIKKWLADHANRFVNVFRPRIEKIISEGLFSE